jgi:hypothetical protein
MNCCETCAYFAYDEEYEEYFCSADMDEDEMYRLLNDNRDGCKYYRCGDEYKVVRKQN